ncbi:hypothetical protein B2G69_07220 [Methylorubrum zatmanii]|nr:hypothetical protein [Methylorubrum zatmanii]ARO53960.1 hypothetical protein B2G69_07220 [Methylorubrum zatmanii]
MSANLQTEALRLWREREMRFPAFTRRMKPDALDHASGAWARAVEEAAERNRPAPEPATQHERSSR